jgi:hypothetical protein
VASTSELVDERPGIVTMVSLRVNGVRFEAVGPPDQGLRLFPNLQVEDRPPGAGQVFALDIVATVSVGGIVFAHRWEDHPQTGEDLGQWGSREGKLFVPLSREAIERIESVRQHNVNVQLSPTLRFFGQQGPPKSAHPSGQMQLLIPENEWLAALERMGFHGGWVVEVERPSLEGWPKIVGFLDKAAERLASRDAEGAIAQCRATWESLTPLIEAEATEIAAEVDRGSTPEEGEPKKSERIVALRRACLKWAHTGAHPENYAASMEDALLAYRLTASMMSYLSRKEVQAESHAPAKLRSRER